LFWILFLKMSLELLKEKGQEQIQFEKGNIDVFGQVCEHLGSKEPETEWGLLYLINTRPWLNYLSKKYGTTITVDNVPDEEWDKLCDEYDNFWFMGIYKPSQKGQESAKNYWEQYQGYLPDIDKEKDIVSSPFAVTEYNPGQFIAKNWEKWDEMVKKLHERGKKVFIDFVPNHTAIDHPWVESHPEYYVQGNKEQYDARPWNFVEIIDNQGQIRYLAHGKDPFCDSWVDTLQLNYANLDLQKRMEEEMINLAKHADGFRCDMAVLVSPEMFLKNWKDYLSDEEKQNLESSIPHINDKGEVEKEENLNCSFWKRVIPRLKETTRLEGKNRFELIAEAYWEQDKIEEYFDYIYNHDLYRKMNKGMDTWAVGDLRGYLDYLMKNPDGIKNHWVVYTENHDEDRAIEKMGEQFSKPAAVLTAMLRDSIFMVNQGQEKGWCHHTPVQVSRYRNEEENLDIAKFYDDLMAIRRSNLFQTGEIKIIYSENGDQNSIIFEISKTDKKTRVIVAVNMSPWTTYAQIGIDKGPSVIYNLTSGQISDGDQIDNKKLILKLEPGEVKIACLSSVSPDNNKPEDKCVLPEIRLRVCL